jgi:hypothetical protein
MKTLILSLALCLSAFGQAVTIGPTVFTGAGLNDATSGGRFSSAPANAIYSVTISGTGTPNQFQWSKNGGALSAATPISGAAQLLSDGATVKFTATTGHAMGDVWIINATPSGSSSASSFIQDGVGARFRSIEDRLRDTVNISDYAACDGIHVDTAGVRKAFDAVRMKRAANGESRYAGTLNVTGTCLLDDEVLVQNMMGLDFRGQGHRSGFRWVGKNKVGVSAFVLQGVFHSKVSNMTFEVGTSLIVAGTNAASVVFTTKDLHHLITGEKYPVNYAPVGSWSAVNGTFIVTVIDGTHFSIPVNSTGFGAFPTSATVHVSTPLDRFISLRQVTNAQSALGWVDNSQNSFEHLFMRSDYTSHRFGVVVQGDDHNNDFNIFTDIRDSSFTDAAVWFRGSQSYSNQINASHFGALASDSFNPSDPYIYALNLYGVMATPMGGLVTAATWSSSAGGTATYSVADVQAPDWTWANGILVEIDQKSRTGIAEPWNVTSAAITVLCQPTGVPSVCSPDPSTMTFTIPMPVNPGIAFDGNARFWNTGGAGGGAASFQFYGGFVSSGAADFKLSGYSDWPYKMKDFDNETLGMLLDADQGLTRRIEMSGRWARQNYNWPPFLVALDPTNTDLFRVSGGVLKITDTQALSGAYPFNLPITGQYHLTAGFQPPEIIFEEFNVFTSKTTSLDFFGADMSLWLSARNWSHNLDTNTANAQFFDDLQSRVPSPGTANTLTAVTADIITAAHLPPAGPITAATWAAGAATLTMTKVIGLPLSCVASCPVIVVDGMLPTGYNGTFTITGTSADGLSFVVAIATDPGGPVTRTGIAYFPIKISDYSVTDMKIGLADTLTTGTASDTAPVEIGGLAGSVTPSLDFGGQIGGTVISHFYDATPGGLGVLSFNRRGSVLGSLNDITCSGTWTGDPHFHTYLVQITDEGSPDLFRWSESGRAWHTKVSISGGSIALQNGMSCAFAASTGHVMATEWVIVVNAGTIAAPQKIKEGQKLTPYHLFGTNGFETTVPVHVSSLPVVGAGTRAMIDDGNTNILGDVAAGGGSYQEEIIYDGTRWYVANVYAPVFGAGITKLTGEVTATGPGIVPGVLTPTGVGAGVYGDATHSAQITLDTKGRATAAASVLVNGGATGTVAITAACTFTPTTSTSAAFCTNGGCTTTGTVTYVSGGSVACTITPGSLTFTGGFKQ